jgi:RNA polymerase sigma factor (sigma-70 family)
VTQVARTATALLSDAEVIAASLAEPEQFATIFDRHARLIHRYVARRAERQVADDLVAETFLVAFRSRRQYDVSYRDARPWLYGIATHLITQNWRDEARQLRIRHAAIRDLDVPSHEERIATESAARSMRSQLAAALAGLAARDRDVFILTAWEQLTYDETARALSIPVGTVRSRLHRARTTLQKALTGAGQSATLSEVLGR